MFRRDNDKYANLSFRISSLSKVITKQTEKLDKFLAYLGGIVKIIYFIVGLFALQYNK